MFKLRQRCKEFFSDLKNSPDLKTDFDIFYLCLLIGLQNNSRSDPNSYGDIVNEFNDNFTREYSQIRYSIIALVVCAEAKKSGINLDEKASVIKLFEQMTNTDSPSKLSTRGAEAINAYASGGFDLIQKHFSEKPRSMPNFLVRYSELLDTDQQ